MKNNFLLIILCFFGCYSFSQNEASNWYFGDKSGIRFNLDGSITALSDGNLATDEGCATISDKDGNLLFYTDGITVWDRAHNPMTNGKDLSGNPTSTQSAIIVPRPNSSNIFYIFTVDAFNPTSPTDPNTGFNFSIVDMSLNGGMGDVTSKNTNLLGYCSEKISAVLKDCSTQSIWVMTLGSLNGLSSEKLNTFYAYEISRNGLNITPVSSTFNDLDVQDPRGYLKLSPDGTKLVASNATNGLFIYDFDAQSGKVSNQKPITIGLSPTNKPQIPYSVEFSQNSKLLYVTSYYENLDPEIAIKPEMQYSALLQYDLTSTNISNSEIVIDERASFRGGLQLGPNGKIYRAMTVTFNQGSPFLSVINNPNTPGIGCSYEHNAIRLSNNSNQGLPPFIATFFAQKIDIIGNNNTSIELPLCDGDTYRLNTPNTPGASYKWTKNGVLLPDNDYFLDVSSPGFYKVFIDKKTGSCDDSLEGIANVILNPNPTAVNTTLTQCAEDGNGILTTIFNLYEAQNEITRGQNNVTLEFYTDAARTNIIDTPETFINLDLNTRQIINTVYVNVVDNDTKCNSQAEIMLIPINNTNAIAPTELSKCDDDGIEDGFYEFDLTEADTDIELKTGNTALTIKYYKEFIDALLENNELNTKLFTNEIQDQQILFARIENGNTCYDISEVILRVNTLPNTELNPEPVFYCSNLFPEKILINAGSLPGSIVDYTYLWDTGETSYAIETNEIRDYKVTITNTNGCSVEKTVAVEQSSNPKFDVLPYRIKGISKNSNQITVLTIGDGVYNYALFKQDNLTIYRDYQSSNVFENVLPGLYTIRVKEVKNNCGEISEAISVIGFPKFFTPNNDGLNDTWQISGVSNLFFPNTQIRIFNRYGKLLKQLQPLGQGWDGIFNGQILPTDDYWFTVKLQDGRIFKDYFSLKR